MLLMFPLVLLLATLSYGAAVPADGIATGTSGYKSHVEPFFSTYCIKCHGPDKSKGKITLHTLDGDLSTGKELERWELILEMVESGEMPPEDEKQPGQADRKAVAKWIDSGLRDYLKKSSESAPAATARRLTNFEYQNTMRDLLGFELNLIDNLPEDPVKPYHFNNTAQFMLMGMEQMDRYKEGARRVMASAIVDPGKPEIHRTVRTWEANDAATGMGGDEIGIYGNRRNTPASGMGIKSWPSTGEYRIRIKASAILPKGIEQMPLRLLMGYNIGENLAMLQVEPVGTVELRNNVDSPKVYEFRGRIENHPAKPGVVTAKGVGPATMNITPQNLYDDGRLNDSLDALAMPRAVIESIEFEAPVADVWPPVHHTRILFDSPLRASDPAAYVREVLERFMSRAFRRPVTKDELNRFVKIHGIIAAEVDSFEQAMRETLAIVLVSPQFLYHTIAEDSAAMRQYELASRLSYFLWGSMPDEELMNLAAKGQLENPAAIEKQVRRLLADQRSHDFVDNFTTQWLSIDKMKTVKINTSLFPRFLYLVSGGERAGTEMPYRPTIRDFMHDETIGFIAELIKRNASVLNIVDSDFAYLNQPLAAHYGIEGVQGNKLRPVPIKPEHHLGGLLTQGSMLIGNSTGSAPHPIYRAVWLREAILGDEVKPPPADVPALSDTAGDSAANAVTIKDLLALHRKKESCNECHVRLDPWGIPFEHYNATGRFQPMVPKEGTRVRGFNRELDKDLDGYLAYLGSINTVKIMADARVPHGPTVDGMQDLKAYLLKDRKDEIAQALLRKLLTYSIGRELTFRDRFAVEQLFQEAKTNGFKFQDMIVAICQSETFRGIQRKDN